jgi:hypothetical protein
MSHNGKAGNGWRNLADKFRAQVEAAAIRESGLRDLIGLLRAEVKTLKSYVADRDEQLRRYETGAEWEKSREAEHVNAPRTKETDHVQR